MKHLIAIPTVEVGLPINYLYYFDAFSNMDIDECGLLIEFIEARSEFYPLEDFNSLAVL